MNLSSEVTPRQGQPKRQRKAETRFPATTTDTGAYSPMEPVCPLHRWARTARRGAGEEKTGCGGAPGFHRLSGEPGEEPVSTPQASGSESIRMVRSYLRR